MKKILWYLPQITDRTPTDAVERFAYIGCVHQTTPTLEQILVDLCNDPPAYLFFGGDLTGSKEFDTLKYHFYEVVNTAKKLDFGFQMDPLTVCTAFTKKAGNMQRTLRNEYSDLCSYLKDLLIRADMPFEEPDLTSPEAIVEGIRKLCLLSDYGSFSKTLPSGIRQLMADSFSTTSKALLPLIQKLQDLGVAVHMIAGNWDNVPNTAANVGMDTVFDAAAFFRSNGVSFHEQITTIETGTTLHLLVPYWDFWSKTDPVFPREGQQRFRESLPKIREARSIGKQIIMLAHGQPVWETHFPGQECKGYNRDVIFNLDVMIDVAQPDEFIYPHQHDPMKDSDGKPLDVNTHYFLHRLEDAGVEVILEGTKPTPETTTLVTYTPLRHIAHLSVPLKGDRKPLILGGTRLPAMVQPLVE
jgi:hypothetical protein